MVAFDVGCTLPVSNRSNPQFKVLGAIVPTDSIEVVDRFSFFQHPAKFLFHDVPMLGDERPLFDADVDIPVLSLEPIPWNCQRLVDSSGLPQDYRPMHEAEAHPSADFVDSLKFFTPVPLAQHEEDYKPFLRLGERPHA